jgi:hypothetical protein
MPMLLASSFSCEMSKRAPGTPTDVDDSALMFVSDPGFTFKHPQNPPAHQEDLPMLRDIVHFVTKVIRPSTHSVDATRVDMNEVYKGFDYEIHHHLPVVGGDGTDYYMLRFALPFNVHIEDERHTTPLKNMDLLRIRRVGYQTNPSTFSQEMYFEFHSKTVAPPQNLNRTVIHITDPHYVPVHYVPVVGGGDVSVGAAATPWLEYLGFSKRRRGPAPDSS